MIRFRHILALLTPVERRRVAWLLVLMTLGAAVETLGISLVIPTMAVLTRPGGASSIAVMRPLLERLGSPSLPTQIAVGMLALCALYLLKSVFGVFLVGRQTRFTFGLQARLAEDLFVSYLRQPYAFHLQRNSAELMRNLVTEIREFALNVMLPALLLLTEGLVLCGIAALLLFVQPIGAIVVVAVIGGAGFVFHRATAGAVSRWGERRQYHEGLRIQHLQQGLGAVKDVMLLGREDEFVAQHRVHNLEGARAARLHHTLVELPRLGLEFLGVVGLTALVLVMLAQGRDVAAIVPTLGLFAAAAFRLMPSVNRMVNGMHLLGYGDVVVEVLHRELAQSAAAAPRAAAHRLPFAERIELRQVSYAYPGAASLALRDVSLAIAHGETVGFIGTSGAGKSTLVDVILGLLTPQSGRILVDGGDIQENLRGWQDQIGYVPQSIYLTDDTIRRNIAFGLADDQIDDAAVERAIKAAQLEEFVASRPEGLAAMLGERGVRLSGGQRQRLGIARALYHDPAVLVLDEATSALDTSTEQGVMQAVAALHGTKTVLVVAHRLSTVQQCDRLYRLEHGVIAEIVPPPTVLSPQIA